MLDASIYGEFRPQPAPSPFQGIADLMKLRGQTFEIMHAQALAEQEHQAAEVNRMKIAQEQRDLSDQNTIQAAFKDPTQAEKLGKGDTSFLNGAIQPNTQFKLNESIRKQIGDQATLDDKTLARNESHHQVVADAIQGLMALPTDQDRINAYPGVKADLLAKGVTDVVKNIPDSISGKNEDLQQFANYNNFGLNLTRSGMATRKTAADVKTAEAEAPLKNAQAGLAVAETANKAAELPKIQAEAEEEQRKNTLMKSMTPTQWDQQIDEAISAKDHGPLNQRTKALVHQALAQGDFKAAQAAIKDGADQIGRTETALATAKATAGTKIYVSNAEAEAKAKLARPSDPGLDLMAEGVLSGNPPGSRNPIIVKAIWDRAAEIAASRGQNAQAALAAANSAHASKEALNAVTKQYETLKPFAEMAEKNADVLEKQMQKVSDLGAPFLNAPLRGIESKFFGNANVAAFHAAMLPVQADFARILNSPTGSGVLSDTARNELQTAISPNATVGQVKAALDIFRTDAHNRKAAYEAQLKDLGAASVAGGGASTLPKGSGGSLDRATAQKFYDAAGGDPTKARQLAKDNNWKVE
jgi:hypothetical protein